MLALDYDHGTVLVSHLNLPILLGGGVPWVVLVL